MNPRSFSTVLSFMRNNLLRQTVPGKNIPPSQIENWINLPSKVIFSASGIPNRLMTESSDFPTQVVAHDEINIVGNRNNTINSIFIGKPSLSIHHLIFLIMRIAIRLVEKAVVSAGKYTAKRNSGASRIINMITTIILPNIFSIPKSITPDCFIQVNFSAITKRIDLEACLCR